MKTYIFLENNIKLVVHSSYLLNFSKPIDENLQSFNVIIGDLRYSDKLNALGCIIHMGKHLKLDVDTAIQNYIDSVNKICQEKTCESLLILENSAHQGTEIGFSIDHLAKIYQGITDENRERIGFCLDTCHAFASGYDFTDKAKTEQFFTEFDEKIGLSKIVCIHLNDSKKPCNSHVDRHEKLGVGKIGLDGIKNVVQSLKNISFNGPVILETPYDSFESRFEEVKIVSAE